jgi:hypothetical protein
MLNSHANTAHVKYTHTHAHTHAHAHTCIHTRTHTHMHTHIHVHTHAHAHTTHTHAHTHTCAHTFTLLVSSTWILHISPFRYCLSPPTRIWVFEIRHFDLFSALSLALTTVSGTNQHSTYILHFDVINQLQIRRDWLIKPLVFLSLNYNMILVDYKNIKDVL